MPGFWRRPVSRMYSYNLDVGEHYYWPMTKYLENTSPEENRSSSLCRGETPGALTFSERLARKWIDGRRYDTTRCASMSREGSLERSVSAVRSTAATTSASRAMRAVSEVRHGSNEVSSAWLNRGRLREMAGSSARSSSYSEQQRQQEQDYQMKLKKRQQHLLHERQLEQEQQLRQQEQHQQQHIAQAVSRSEATTTISKEESSSSSHSSTVRMASERQRVMREQLLQKLQQQQVQQCARQASNQKKQVRVMEDSEAAIRSRHFQQKRIEDDVAKRIADIRMHPWGDNSQLREAEEASLRSRARICDLERELEEITKKAIMSSTMAMKSAKQLAYQANMEAEEEALASSTKKSRKVIVESSNMIKA